MGKDGFYYQLDDDFRGARVRVHPSDSEHSYEGWTRLWHFDQHAILLYDATRDDGEELGPVTINEPKVVERLDSRGPILQLPVGAIRPSPYDARSYDDVDHQQFARQTRERGHLLTFPSVRPLDNGEYETVGGHRRMEAARRAGLADLPVRVVKIDEWEAARQFVDEHIPIRGGDERGMYGQEAIDRTIARLREKWSDDRLRELSALAPYLEEKLASTRREGMRQGYLADGRGTE